MALESDIFAALSGQTAAASRVYPLIRGEASALPAIVYARVGNAPVNALDGSSGLDSVRIQIDSYAATYAGAKLLAAQVRAIMQAGSFKALLQSDVDVYEPDTKIYRVTQDFLCWERVL